MSYICPKCSKEFEKAQSIRAHKGWCIQNRISPNKGKAPWNKGLKTGSLTEEHKDKIRKSNTGKILSQSHKKKLASTINSKIKSGNWHNSFSRARTHDYNGIKLYGKWELAYAQYLDKNSISWSRPDNRFKYTFENKEHFYTPDFYLIDQDLYIEIKGYKTKKDEAKWSQFPLKLKVLTGKELREMNLIDSYKILR